MVNKGNHPQMAELFRLVNYYNLPRFMEQRSQVQPRVPRPPAAGARDGKRPEDHPEDPAVASTRRGVRAICEPGRRIEMSGELYTTIKVTIK